MNKNALPAVVHPQRQRSGAPVDHLHAEEPGAVAGPIVEIFGPDADISKSVEMHRGSLLPMAELYHSGDDA